MDRQRKWQKRMRVASLVTLAAAYSMPGFGCIENVTGVVNTLGRNFNPCGTILVCDPMEWEYAVQNVDPYNPDYEECPLSADASECLYNWPPTAGGGGGGNGTDTGTNTGTGTATGG